MARYDNRHSRRVAWLKVLLPLASLGILTSMFLLSRDLDPSQTIPFVELSVEDLAREERIGGPNYAGVTEDGAAISVRAEAARPIIGSGGTRISVQGIDARLDRPETGTATALRAQKGLIDTDAQTLRLTGAVGIDTADGLALRTDSLRARLDRTEVETSGPVTGTLRGSRLEAGRMVLTGDAAGLRALFTGGVKLVYLPERTNDGLRERMPNEGD